MKIAVIILVILYIVFSALMVYENRDIIYIEKINDVTLGLEQHEDIRRELREELLHMKSLRLEAVRSFLWVPDTNWFVDPVILLSDGDTELFSTVNVSKKHKLPNTTADWINMLFAKKIEGKWHVYVGGNLVVPRYSWQYDHYQPLDEDQLSYIAYEQFIRTYVEIDGKGSAIVRKDLVENDVNKIADWHPLQISDDINERFKYYTKLKYEKRISEEEYYSTIEKRANRSAQSIKPQRKPPSLWKRLLGEKPPIFERDIWKNRNKN